MQKSNKNTKTNQSTPEQVLFETALLEDLRFGLPEAVAIWYGKYYQAVLQFVLSKVDSSRDSEEIAQQVFMNALRHLPLFRGESSILTWMCGIARHEVADYYRKKYAKKALKTIPLVEWLFVGIDSVHDATETAEIVWHVLSQMTPKYRSLLLSKYVDEQSVAALAHKADRSPKAIESDLYRARQEFKVLWQAAQ